MLVIAMWTAVSAASTCAGALDSLDQLSAERSNLEKAFKWEWDNDDVLKNRAQASTYDPEAPYREGVRRSVAQSLKSGSPVFDMPR